MIALHGTAQTGKSFRAFANDAFDRFADNGHLVAYPDALHREWNGARTARMLWRDVKTVDDIGFLRALVEDVAARYGIDAGRVYVIGFSLGGQMVFRVLHDAPDLVAAAAVISANQPAAGNFTGQRDNARPVPLVTIHGTADPLSRFDGGVLSFRGLFPKGEHLSAAQTAEYFARRNGIDSAPDSRRIGPDEGISGATPVHRTDYRQAGKPPVTLYAVVGAGHQIPGASTGAPILFGKPTRALDAVAVIAEFFDLSLYPGGREPQ